VLIDADEAIAVCEQVRAVWLTFHVVAPVAVMECIHALERIKLREATRARLQREATPPVKMHVTGYDPKNISVRAESVDAPAPSPTRAALRERLKQALEQRLRDYPYGGDNSADDLVNIAWPLITAALDAAERGERP
jgi:hypothetical protein